MLGLADEAKLILSTTSRTVRAISTPCAEERGRPAAYLELMLEDALPRRD
jgi:hypothetical protein